MILFADNMRVLLSFTGFHDPYVPGTLEGELRAGPILTVVGDREFDKVYLFSTPKLNEISARTKAAIEKHYASTAVDILEVPLKDPTNYLGILRQLRFQFKKLHSHHPHASYHIAVSSGTPQMHACWFLLAASREIPARILQSTPPEFVPEGRSCVKEIDFDVQEFPHVSQSLQSDPEQNDEDEVISSACREIGILGDDPAFRKCIKQAYIFGQYDDVHVLLLGETGSGKEYVTRFIHQIGRRAARPLVTVNCSSIPEQLVESQLFGHLKGAFTGANANQEGKFKAADGGILFLDELGELPLPAQAKLLRVLEEGEIEPVGATRPIKINVRVIGATNRDLRNMVLAGTFREDLYQRFGCTVRIPPLRERRTDISLLALHILDAWNKRHEKQRKISPDAVRALIRHPWTGNVRELRKVVTQSAMLAPKTVIQPQDLQFEEVAVDPLSVIPEPAEGFRLNEYLDELKARIVERALGKAAGNQAMAARLLGITPQAVNQRLKSRDHQ